MRQYKDLLAEVLMVGLDSDDRTGTGTLSLFGKQMRFDLEDGFPLVTIKKTYWKAIVVELLWLMQGSTNVKFLQKHGVKIWDEWADKDGDLGPVYGEQWRKWKTSDLQGTGPLNTREFRTVDQLKEVIERIKTNPNCRRLIVSAWNVAEIPRMKLPPCHCFFQFYVRNGKLSCHLYQRSADLFLGVPFNIASYALLTRLIAHNCHLEPGELIHSFGDVHLYKNHLDQARELLDRTPKILPEVDIDITPDRLMGFVDIISPRLTWDQISEKITLRDYDSHPALKGAVSV